jgi:hypothetical protein
MKVPRRKAPAEIAPEPRIAEPYAEPVHQPVHEPVHAEASELTAFVADLEASLGDSFPQALASPLPSPPPKLAQLPEAAPLPGWPGAHGTEARCAAGGSQTPEPEPSPQATHDRNSGCPGGHAATAAASAGGAATAAAPAPAMSYSPTPPFVPWERARKPCIPPDSVDLSEMFGELKQELEEEIVAGDDDPETHYNLGVAFREMGLLDEAIAELQKVCTAIDRGKAFSQPVQTYTWLAQCFLDKGVPQAAIRWYEKALSIPGLDDEARLAINYELGVGLRNASDKPAALRHFTSRLRHEHRLSRRRRAHSGSEVVECTKWVRNLRWDATDPAPTRRPYHWPYSPP